MRQNKPIIAATNPLHYVYLCKNNPQISLIASLRGMFFNYAQELGFSDKQLTFYDVPNTPEALIAADRQSGNNEDAAYISWRPAQTSAPVLGNTYKQVHGLECKATIRELLPAELFPNFIITETSDVAQLAYESLCEVLQTQKLVLQVDDSTGGKGTFVVFDADAFASVLPTLVAANQRIVISKFIAGTSRAVQCLRMHEATYTVPWWHRDLVGASGVCNMAISEATRYAGAILENIPETYRQQVATLVEQVTHALERAEYYGVFGIDIVVDEAAEKVYLIEINSRFTAVSHLYATAMHAVGYGTDFMTAHVLGLVGADTTRDVASFTVAQSLPAAYYYVKVQNLSSEPLQLSDACRLGVYRDGAWQRLGWGVDALQDEREVVIIPEAATGSQRKPGERAFSMIGTGSPLNAATGFNTAPWLERFLTR